MITPLMMLSVPASVVIAVALMFFKFIRPMRRALQRISTSATEHASLQHNTSAGALEWAQEIARAALDGKKAPAPLEGAKVLNFPAHCERLGEELLELAGRREIRDLGRSAPTSVRILLNALPQEAMPVRRLEEVIREVAAVLDMEREDLKLELVGVSVERAMRGSELKVNLEEMAGTLFEAGGTALLERAYGGPARRVPAAQVKRMVAKADELRLRAQDLI